jgi:hypothetical protein
MCGSRMPFVPKEEWGLILVHEGYTMVGAARSYEKNGGNYGY